MAPSPLRDFSAASGSNCCVALFGVGLKNISDNALGSSDLDSVFESPPAPEKNWPESELEE